MKFWISYRTYNGGGGFYEGAIASDVLENQKIFFGEAIKEIEFLLCFKRRDPSDMSGVKKSLWNMHAHYHDKFCNTLPYRKFERREKRLVITTVATFGVAQDLRHMHDDANQPYRKEWIEAILDQLILEIEACRKKFKSSDEFEYDAFLDWLKISREEIPKSKITALKLREESQKRFELERSKISDWEKLAIDWDDFHPNSRAIVPYPKLWSCIEDFSPNGNDTGADVLERLRDNDFDIPISFDQSKQSYKDLLAQIGIQQVSPSDDSSDYIHYKQIIVGLTFACLKLKGSCSRWLIDITISEIDKFCTYLKTHRSDWKYCDEALEYQTIMKKCLNEL